MKKKSLNKQIRRYIGRSIRCHSRNEYDKTLRCINKAISINQSIAELYIQRGTINTIVNEEQAIKDYTKAIELDQKCDKAYYERGLLNNFIYEETEKSINDYTKAIKINPNKYEYYENRAAIYSTTEQYNLSIVDYTKVIALKPNYFSAYIYRGKDYSYINETDKAREDFLTALKLAKYSCDTYNASFNLGHLEIQQNNYEKAIFYYTTAIKQDYKRKAEAYFERGCCYVSLEEYENAISDFTQAINLALKDSNYSDEIAEFYSERAGAYLALSNEIAYKADCQMSEEFKSGKRAIE